jgi:hypothetical protein
MKKTITLITALLLSTSAFADKPTQADVERATGKCFKNVRIVGDHLEGDWVCAPPRAATPEEEQSLTEK